MTETDKQTKMTLGELLRKLQSTKLQLKKVQKQTNDLTEQKDLLETEVIRTMTDMGLSQIKNEYGTISISEAIFAQIEDVEAFYEHLLDTKQPWLLQRRPNLTAYRELLAQGETVPGIKPFIRKQLSVRK